MEVDRLFKGIAVIIDDEINNNQSAIYRIKTLIEEKNIPVLGYNVVPDTKIVDSLNSASFVILDWEFTKTLLDDSTQSDKNPPLERILPPTTLDDEVKGKLIDFLKVIMSTLFIPIFIFTDQDQETIKGVLQENELWNDKLQNRIFIKSKSELNTADELFGAIQDWLTKMPSVYVLKEWENIAIKTKNKMFLDMYQYSPNWVRIIWDMIKEDSLENQNEFGDFLTRSFTNRIVNYLFKEDMIGEPKEVPQNELSAVIEAERYFSYSDILKKQIIQAYTGDLFKKEGKYYLNIRAQCDLSRGKKGEEYNPVLYCIKGEKVGIKSITTGGIAITEDGKLIFPNGKEFDLKELKDTSTIKKINKCFKEHTCKITCRYGELLEKKPEVIIPCIDNERAIKFELKIEQYRYNAFKQYLIGRVLPPYITRIQQKCAQYIVRTGCMPVPESLFRDVDE